MAHLQYFNYEGYGQRMRKEQHYSQAVRVGNIIEVSGQGSSFSFIILTISQVFFVTSPSPKSYQHPTQEAGTASPTQSPSHRP